MKLLTKFSLALISILLPVQNAFAQAQKTEESFVIQKFAVAIGMVVFFAAVLYGVLFLYKKFFTNQPTSPANILQDNSLESPSDLNEAIATFLEKTKPNQ